MRRLFAALVISIGLGSATATVMFACGSKYLVSTRGAHYQRLLASIEPTNILFYWRQDENTKEEDRWDPEAGKMLRRFGHSFDVTFDADAFLLAAKEGEFDVLVVPIDEARRFQSEMSLVAPNSAVLPMLFFPTRSEYSRARAEFDVVMKLPTTSPKFLAAVELARSSAR